MGGDVTGKRVLGLDYGSRRIGVAVSDPLGLTVQPLPRSVGRGIKRTSPSSPGSRRKSG
ncbi:MAG: Holliday junction resolvase RuvX [Candidatus Deferrimicrobiaceae bacterium]